MFTRGSSEATKHIIYQFVKIINASRRRPINVNDNFGFVETLTVVNFNELEFSTCIFFIRVRYETFDIFGIADTLVDVYCETPAPARATYGFLENRIMKTV